MIFDLICQLMWALPDKQQVSKKKKKMTQNKLAQIVNSCHYDPQFQLPWTMQEEKANYSKFKTWKNTNKSCKNG